MFKDKWNGLGGKIEINESPEECVVREVFEESGLTISNPKLKGIITFPANAGSDETWYVFVFVANQFSGKLIESLEGELQWIDDNKIIGLNIHEGDHLFLPWLKNKKFFSAKLCYNNFKLTSHKVNFY